MNEQLVVKNFGPIKDATVDFKRVTVFIGPTGGGKSTLAKLAAVFRDKRFLNEYPQKRAEYFQNLLIKTYFSSSSLINWLHLGEIISCKDDFVFPSPAIISDTWTRVTLRHVIPTDIKQDNALLMRTLFENTTKFKKGEISEKAYNSLVDAIQQIDPDALEKIVSLLNRVASDTEVSPPTYIPSERSFVASIEYSWAGLMRDDIGLPKTTLDFANRFSISRKDVLELDIPFLNVKYLHVDGRDFIKIPEREEPLMLLETASGVQSVTPLLVLLEHLSRNTEQAQSFIIEEPELNLFPIAQFELVKTLVEKCARLDGQNDLVLTTHSPYVLTALNLMCYAFRIAQQDEATAKKVAKLIPRHCWIDPEQFAAYYVDRPDTKRKQQVRSIINKKTGLIEENELDTASEELSNIFDKLLDLRQPVKSTARAK